MKYVEIDERTGTVSWDRYFDYIKSIKGQLPPDLYAYASNWDHYSLDSKASLHDAWLTTARFSYQESEMILEFLGPWHDRTIVYRYIGVKAYAFNLVVTGGPGEADVLAHEFRIEDGRLAHEIVFSTRKEISVICEHLMVRADMHAEGRPTRN
jgi:hypothetical protein